MRDNYLFVLNFNYFLHMNDEELRRDVSLFGTVRYYNKADQLHREGGPAVICVNGHKEWFIEGARHRTDGPAVEYDNEDKAWYQNGKLHRLDGPAYEGSDGTKEWWIEGKRHRLDGPAVERHAGGKEWWIKGKYYRTEEEWLYARCPSIEEVAAMFKEVQS